MRIMRTFAILFALMLAVSGCATRSTSDSLRLVSYDGVSVVYPQAVTPIAEKTALDLAGRYTAASTPILLVHAPEGTLGAALEEALRVQGFPMTTSMEPETLQVAYTLDLIKEQSKTTCYLQVKASDGATFGNMYDLNDAAMPVATGSLAQVQPFFTLEPPVNGASLTPNASASPEVEMWMLTAGSFKTQLEEWAHKADYQLVWKAEHDYSMQAKAVFKDSFIGAVKRVFTRMHLSGNSLRASIYEDNRVIEVVED